jgi:hypothetical protein
MLNEKTDMIPTIKNKFIYEEGLRESENKNICVKKKRKGGFSSQQSILVAQERLTSWTKHRVGKTAARFLQTLSTVVYS